MQGQPNFFFNVALAAFVPVTFSLVGLLGGRRGVAAALIGGWLFLPSYTMSIGPPLFHTKEMFVGAVVLAASLLLDLRRWAGLRPGWIDLPMAVLCLGPFLTALANDLGPYEGASAAFAASMTWGAPYALARLYYGRPGALREFAMAIVIAALVYVPFCLWEVRMSPQLHVNVYGYSNLGAFAQVMRYGGFRPNVFLAHGLAVGMFMALGTLVAAWLWRTGAVRTLLGVSFGWAVGLLAVTTILCKSTGAIILLGMGLLALEATRRLRTPLLVLVLLAIPVAYAGARIAGWSGRELVTAAERGVNPERAQSVHFRLENEDMLIDKALARPWLGWGRFGRSRVFDESGRDLVITDGLWIIALGINGFVGLVALWALLALPALLLLRMFRAWQWSDPRLAAATSLAVGALLWGIDDIFNAMLSPVFPAITGAVLSFYLLVRTARARGRTPIRAARPAGRRPRWIPSHGS